MHDIKSFIISKLGGGGEVARICGITPGAVSQWELIPSRHQAPILKAAKERGLDLKPEHFFGAVSTKKPKKVNNTN